MQPIIPMWLIYLAGVSDGIRIFLIMIGIILFVGAGIYVLYYLSEVEDKLPPKIVSRLMICLLIILLGCLTPTQQTAYTMMIGSQMTPNNIELVGGTFKSTVDYMFEKAEDLIEDTEDKD